MAVVQSDTALSAKVPTLTGSKPSSAICMRELSITPIFAGTGNTGRLYVCGGQPLANRRLCGLASITPPPLFRMQPAQ